MRTCFFLLIAYASSSLPLVAEAKRYTVCNLLGVPLEELARDPNVTNDKVVKTGNRRRRVRAATSQSESLENTTNGIAVTREAEEINTTGWLKFYGRECVCSDSTVGNMYCPMESSHCGVPFGKYQLVWPSYQSDVRPFIVDSYCLLCST